MHSEMPIKEMAKEAEIKKYAGTVKPTKRSIGGTRNATSVARRDIQRPTVPRLKSIKTMMARAQEPPVVEQV